MAKQALVIDDDKFYLVFVCNVLEKAGWKVDAAVNGRTAMALMEERDYDLIVTDIFMPEQEGLETIISVGQRYPRARILAMTSGGANPAFDYLLVARKLGAHGCIQKPFLPSSLLSQAAVALETLPPAQGEPDSSATNQPDWTDPQ